VVYISSIQLEAIREVVMLQQAMKDYKEDPIKKLANGLQEVEEDDMKEAQSGHGFS
jgi:hypothetical protein